MSSKVIVLGCGPSGLLAAHAAKYEYGAEVYILSDKRPSQLYGCQYLHEPIPGLLSSKESRMVNYTLVGTVDEYRRKVYGDIPLPPVSPQQFLGERPAWDIRAAYAELWDEYCGLISNQRLTNLSVPEIMKGWKPDLIINTIPAKALCDEPFRHSFTEQACYAMGDAPALGQRVPIPTEPFTVVCDGTKDAGYYRKANVFDHATVEWPGNRKRPPIEGVVGFSKPLSTNCDCWPEVHRAGRHGLWKKGILVHHVYSDVANRMKVLEGA